MLSKISPINEKFKIFSGYPSLKSDGLGMNLKLRFTGTWNQPKTFGNNARKKILVSLPKPRFWVPISPITSYYLLPIPKWTFNSEWKSKLPGANIKLATCTYVHSQNSIIFGRAFSISLPTRTRKKAAQLLFIYHSNVGQ